MKSGRSLFCVTLTARSMCGATGVAAAQCVAVSRSNEASHGSRPPLYQRDVMPRSSDGRVACCAPVALEGITEVTSRPSGGCDARALAAIGLCDGSVSDVSSALNAQIDAVHRAWQKGDPSCPREHAGLDDVEWSFEVVSKAVDVERWHLTRVLERGAELLRLIQDGGSFLLDGYLNRSYKRGSKVEKVRVADTGDRWRHSTAVVDGVVFDHPAFVLRGSMPVASLWLDSAHARKNGFLSEVLRVYRLSKCTRSADCELCLGRQHERGKRRRKRKRGVTSEVAEREGGDDQHDSRGEVVAAGADAVAEESRLPVPPSCTGGSTAAGADAVSEEGQPSGAGGSPGKRDHRIVLMRNSRVYGAATDGDMNGLFALEDCRRGDILVEYTGKLLTEEEDAASSSDYRLMARRVRDRSSPKTYDTVIDGQGELGGLANYACAATANAKVLDLLEAVTRSGRRPMASTAVVLVAVYDIAGGQEVRFEYDGTGSGFREALIARGVPREDLDSGAYLEHRWQPTAAAMSASSGRLRPDFQGANGTVFHTLEQMRIDVDKALRGEENCLIPRGGRGLAGGSPDRPAALPAAPSAATPAMAETVCVTVRPELAAAEPALAGAALVGCVVRIVKVGVEGTVVGYNAIDKYHTISVDGRERRDHLGKIGWELVQRGVVETEPKVRERVVTQRYGKERASSRVSAKYQATDLPVPISGGKGITCLEERHYQAQRARSRDEQLVYRGSADADMTAEASDVAMLS